MGLVNGLVRSVTFPFFDEPLKTLILFVLFDLWMCCRLRLNHRLRPLWMPHRAHHSRVVAETHSNYSSVFSFRDRLLGSYRMREDTRSIDLGLNILREDRRQGFPGILLTPFSGRFKPG